MTNIRYDLDIMIYLHCYCRASCGEDCTFPLKMFESVENDCCQKNVNNFPKMFRSSWRQETHLYSKVLSMLLATGEKLTFQNGFLTVEDEVISMLSMLSFLWRNFVDTNSKLSLGCHTDKNENCAKQFIFKPWLLCCQEHTKMLF